MTSRRGGVLRLALAVGAALAASLWAPGAEAQVKTVRLAKQFGISYLPLTIMEDKKLLEEQAKKLGVEVRTEWLQLSAGSPMNEALISGNLDFASGGVGPLLDDLVSHPGEPQGQGRRGHQLDAASASPPSTPT